MSCVDFGYDNFTNATLGTSIDGNETSKAVDASAAESCGNRFDRL